MSLTERYDKARDAFSKKDVKLSKEIHSKPLASAETHNVSGTYLKSVVYGGLDGTLTTFSIVSAVAGAALSPSIILVLGFANLVGDGFGMAVGDYLTTKAEMEYQEHERKREMWELETNSEGEKSEMVEIYEGKGISKKNATQIVDKMANHKEAFVDIMMVEELGINQSNENPIHNAIVTFFSFISFGVIPLLIYLLAQVISIKSNLFIFAIILTGITLFVLGAVKTHITKKNWLMSGLETLIIGAIAATVSYGIGYALHGLA